MITPAVDPWLPRFLAPQHAICNHDSIEWQGIGRAETPAEDAHCAFHVALVTGDGTARVAAAAFTVFGPPVAVACADWACERSCGRTVDAARALGLRDAERELALAPDQRYAALLALDALAAALNNVLARPSSNLG